ncbi:MAG: NAD-dependent DNA ligase LigA [Myxococcales bacterium]|nr:NAD-dependent DNA ligase LigA [Myxococcales bacterium]
MPLPEGWESWPVDRLAAEVAEHNRRYWDDNEPLVSDYDYDRLVERLRAVAPDHPVLSAMGPSSENQPGDPVTHAVPMLSLDKAYDEETLQKWAAKFEGDLVMTPKVDGVACSIRYGADGRLQVAATRGSGTVGEDITANVLRIPDVPAAIPVDHPIEVRGEVYLPLSRFRELAGQFANPRNTAAGALKQKDADRSAKMGLRFFCYDVVGDRADTELDKFALAASWGFSPVEHALVSRDEVQQGYEAYVARRAELDFEIDGVVFKANRLDEQARLGATSHHPRYAIAYKLQGDSATTVLREVEWSVSRTGALTPVGIVAPVSLSGATVTRISLHNWGLVQQKELTIGATVAAMRRGGVIPYLEAVVEPGEGAIEPPGSCPSCGTGVEIRGDFVVCPNVLGCPAQSVGILSHYAKITGIEGFGQVWLDTLVEHGALQSPVDYYRLTADALVRFERMGKTLAEKLVAQIDATRDAAARDVLAGARGAGSGQDGVADAGAALLVARAGAGGGAGGAGGSAEVRGAAGGAGGGWDREAGGADRRVAGVRDGGGRRAGGGAGGAAVEREVVLVHGHAGGDEPGGRAGEGGGARRAGGERGEQGARLSGGGEQGQGGEQAGQGGEAGGGGAVGGCLHGDDGGGRGGGGFGGVGCLI